MCGAGKGEFCCHTGCPQIRSCSPVIYPQPQTLSSNNDSRVSTNMMFMGKGCCIYDDMESRSMNSGLPGEEPMSLRACLWLCSVNDKCIGASVGP